MIDAGYCYRHHADLRCAAAASSSPSRVSGRPLGPRIPNGGGILRPVLHRILSEATRAAGATVRLGVGVSAIEQDDDDVSK